MGQIPLYVIKIRGGYYSKTSAWTPVEKEKATRLSHKVAYEIRGKLKRLGYQPIVEQE